MFNRFVGRGVFTVGLAALGIALPGLAAAAPPTFSQAASPNTVSPGSVSRLTYTIDNAGASVITDMAFSATLPSGVTLATSPDAVTTCGGNGGAAAADLTAPSGGSSITFANGTLSALANCTVAVNIVASSAGSFTLPTTTLTSSEPDDNAASISFTAVASLPSFTLSAAPSTLNLGDTSTLTFTVDNSLNASRVGNVDFTATLPSGLEIANPSNAATDCVAASLPDTTLTAVSGGSTIQLDADGSTLFPGFEVLDVGATCTVTVNVLSTGIGEELVISAPSLLADFVDAGGASATVTVNATDLNITASVLNTPVNAGSAAQVEFTILNRNRTQSATGVAFTSDPALFSPIIPGMTTTLVSNTCGGTVGDGATLQLTGGTIAPEATCTVRADFNVPAATVGGNYAISTTTTVSGTVASASVTGNMTSALFAIPSGGVAPIVAIEFLEAGTLAPNPTPSPGDDVVLRTTITNGSSSSAATDVGATLVLVPPLPFPLSVGAFPTDPCGVGSSLAFTFPDTDEQNITLSGGTLPAFPAIGSSCTFDLTLTVSTGTSPGAYGIVAQGPTATIGGGSVTGAGAADTLNVGAGLNLVLSKSFLSAGFPGSTVDMELIINNASDTADAGSIAFTDDLNAALSGLTVASIPSDNCGGTAGGTGTSNFTYTGGQVNATQSCTIVARLNIPAGAAVGTYTNVTSDMTATPLGGGTLVTFPAASADLVVTNATFDKEFLNTTVIPGDTTTLRYTIANLDPSNALGITFFTDNLAATFAGFAATGPASLDTCGGTL
ncbi:MAG: hypothetical protein AAFN94_07710, partial [Pseudomonadota bacterium]